MAKMPNWSDDIPENADDVEPFRVPISERPPDEGAIFLPSEGYWFDIPVNRWPHFDILDLKVYNDDDPTSEDAILLCRFQDDEGDVVIAWTTIVDLETLDSEATELILETMIYHDNDPSITVDSCTDCPIESDEDWAEIMEAFEQDEIERLRAEKDNFLNDWSSVDSIYD
jgi:hypothetical protein